MHSKIAVISPSSIVTQKMKEEVEKRNLDIVVRQAFTVDAVNEAEELILKGVKIIISRGVTASALRKNLDIPIVDIKHTFFDCYTAYKKARTISDKIAFLATSKGFEHILERSKDLLEGVTIIPINLFEDKEVIDAKLSQLVEMGIEVAIGGLTLEKKVTSLGIKYVMTEADSEALRQAIDEALHLIRIEIEKEARRMELENKYEMINSIFNCVSEGIISYDSNGFITNINNNAIRVLGQQIEGKKINEILTSDIFMEAVQNGESITNEIINSAKTSFVVNIEPVKVDSHIIGAVATLQQSKQIQAVEQKIRHTMLNKGHVSDKTFDDIIGESEKICLTKELAMRYAAVDSTVLILGDTGTGKELFAQSIHNYSNRREAPFVAINCGAFPPSVLESELFGYVKGAFTGALNEGKAGIFELAHRGTIFLDEISETPLDVQIKLLRVIQERKIIRIGDDKVIPIDVRIITASNKDLKKQIKEGLFREDLYYRICVLELKIPSLKERAEDIPGLVRHFIENSKTPVQGITNKAMNMLASAEWPGNIRQLSNIIERLIVICNNGVISSEMVEEAADIVSKESVEIDNNITKIFDEKADNKGQNKNTDVGETMTEVELIKKVLIETRGNRGQAAEKLGISTTTLWRKIKKIDSIDEDFLKRVRYGEI
ncbi:Transcriptional regulator containing PAS, AAA-type ATPase, and DNA-binding Fis domains [Proteiniborus ethanoligenes]|uniref:Transcriptional regulator containing PAS, AAA-type ATPase, and DNA-binding Fis domains n=1 Tax=Proteiniborus ethanoligenes TaxID=415015 RepID=A0A1H3KQ58_9FIRM|nr:sigma 54-interacting transcriptional regulator [Proteiniborus ethanoligenes]TAH63798.1 MAG: AAA family ATPase [Gottschalkiaceae bacterium]SDY54302.1 Transcriptional regulator containing PAS, AAA-type ATPase, and DNA-binding Fis domains [Proteiniborus ethanoligenes]